MDANKLLNLNSTIFDPKNDKSYIKFVQKQLKYFDKNF